MTAVGVLTRVFLGEDPAQSDPIPKGTALMLDRLARWDPEDGSIDMYYWYYATLAMFQVGGEPWKRWLAHQEEQIERLRRGVEAGTSAPKELSDAEAVLALDRAMRSRHFMLQADPMGFASTCIPSGTGEADAPAPD